MQATHVKEQQQLYRPLPACLICHTTNLTPVLDLGEHYLTDFLDAPDPNHPKAPLQLNYCEECDFLQLGHMVERDRLFRNYHYRSGVNDTMRRHLQSLADEFPLNIYEGVLDIGANDGTFLRYFAPFVERAGFEPAKNLTEEASQGGNIIIADYFNCYDYRQATNKESPHLITTLAMFYDLSNPVGFAKDVASLMAKDTIWIMEVNYAGDLIQTHAIDFIGHEHVGNYSLRAIERVLDIVGLEVFNLTHNKINGSTLRCYIARKGVRPVTRAVSEFREKEVRLGQRGILELFAKEVERIKDDLLSRIHSAQYVYAYGASTRGMTTLQWLGLDNSHVRVAIDKNPEKHDKYMAGLNIPIMSEEDFRHYGGHDTLFVLPWGFADEFAQREAEFLNKGGRMLAPFPEPRWIKA